MLTVHVFWDMLRGVSEELASPSPGSAYTDRGDNRFLWNVVRYVPIDGASFPTVLEYSIRF